MKSKILSLLFTLTVLIAFCQNNINVTVKVSDFKEQPLTDVMVFLDTTKVDVRVNKRGFFKIKVPETTNSINVFSPKYGLLSSNFEGEEKMNIVFLNPSERLNNDDVIVTDFNLLSPSEEHYTNANINIGDDPNSIAFNNIYDYIRGRVAGVTISGDNIITIRGPSSISTTNNALLVVNGMQVDNISYINVNEIENIKVLKDGASIYGSRGANGVLEITLKK